VTIPKGQRLVSPSSVVNRRSDNKKRDAHKKPDERRIDRERGKPTG
jgi:hypothetical protein